MTLKTSATLSNKQTTATETNSYAWMTSLRLFFSCFFCFKTAIKAVKVAFVVAPVLILINNFELVFSGVLAEASSIAFIAKISMTLLVPFFVSGFSSAML